VLHPIGPLFDQETQTLRPRCVRALKRILFFVTMIGTVPSVMQSSLYFNCISIHDSNNSLNNGNTDITKCFKTSAGLIQAKEQSLERYQIVLCFFFFFFFCVLIRCQGCNMDSVLLVIVSCTSRDLRSVCWLLITHRM
jgi:hypothetical protein